MRIELILGLAVLLLGAGNTATLIFFEARRRREIRALDSHMKRPLSPGAWVV